MEETEVANWLTKIKEGQHAQKFQDKGFEKVLDIEEEDIELILESEKQGVKRRLIRLLSKEKSRIARELPLPDVANIPAGERLDLSNKQIDFEGASFSIPSEVPVSSKGEIFSPYELTKAHWITIAKNTHCLYGKVIGDNGPRDARKPALLWKIPENDNFVLGKTLGGSVTSEMKYTSQSSNFVRAGFHKGSASFNAPFVSGSGSYEHSEKHARSSKYKVIYMLGIWDFPRAQLFLDECTEVSDEFIQEIQRVTDAVDQVNKGKDASLIEKQRKIAIESLSKIFDDYGHLIGNVLDLGGRLYFTHKESASGTVNENEKRQVASAALSIKTFTSSGNASYQGETSSASVKEAQNLSRTINFRAKGGDTTLANNPSEWAGTVKDPNLWAIIRYHETKRTVDLLSDTLRKKVEDIWGLCIDSPLHNKTFHFENGHSIGSLMVNSLINSNPNFSVLSMTRKWVVSDPKNKATQWKLEANSYYNETNLYTIKDTSGRYLSFQKEKVMIPPHPVPQDKWVIRLLGSQPSPEMTSVLWRIYPVNEGMTDFNEGMYYIESFIKPKVKLHRDGTYWGVASGEAYHDKDPDGDGRREMWYFIPAD